ncbi:MAG: hypothetical protein VX071_07515, partial [Candidatus Thermoplasmatota archaeon]|nr:hypothetical protein [Candidatus Thermoplasmatota archaeon]
MSELYQARLEDLKEIASAYGLAKNGSVEYLRAQLIRDLILPEWDLTLDGLKNILNSDLGDLLGVFGIKKTGSLRTRRQRLYLHLNHDPKQLKEENLDKMTKEELHALCKALELPRSGNRQTLLIRVAGVLSAQHKNWGTIKRSLKRRGGSVTIPTPGDSDQEEIETASIEEEVESFVTEHPEGWTFEDESELMESIDSGGIDTSLSEVAASIEETLVSHRKEIEQPVPPMLQELSSEEPTLEEEAALLEISSRRAEVEAAARDYLLVGTTTDMEDMNTFISSLSNHGFAVELARVQD